MLETYVQSSEEKILKEVTRKGVENQDTASSFKERRRTENIQGWKEVPLYGQFARQSENQRNDETWTWLKEGKPKRETESLTVAAQDQAIRTNYVKATMCKQSNETICHIVSACARNCCKKNTKRDMTT